MFLPFTNLKEDAKERRKDVAYQRNLCSRIHLIFCSLLSFSRRPTLPRSTRCSKSKSDPLPGNRGSRLRSKSTALTQSPLFASLSFPQRPLRRTSRSCQRAPDHLHLNVVSFKLRPHFNPGVQPDQITAPSGQLSQHPDDLKKFSSPSSHTCSSNQPTTSSHDNTELCQNTPETNTVQEHPKPPASIHIHPEAQTSVLCG